MTNNNEEPKEFTREFWEEETETFKIKATSVYPTNFVPDYCQPLSLKIEQGTLTEQEKIKASVKIGMALHTAPAEILLANWQNEGSPILWDVALLAEKLTPPSATPTEVINEIETDTFDNWQVETGTGKIEGFNPTAALDRLGRETSEKPVYLPPTPVNKPFELYVNYGDGWQWLCSCATEQAVRMIRAAFGNVLVYEITDNGYKQL